MATNIDEQLSALMDGELTDGEAAQVLATMRLRPELRERWARYHFISDGLHKGLPTQPGGELPGRVAGALEREPLIVAPAPRRRGLSPRLKQAAGMAAAACVTAAAILGFQYLEPVLPWVAEQTAPAEPVFTGDGDLAPYLLNHNEHLAGGGYGMLPYARLVSHNDAFDSE